MTPPGNLSNKRLGGLFFFGLLLPGALDVDLAELLEVDFGGAVRHEVGAFVIFGEGDDFADAVFAADEHGDAVEAEGEAAVGRGAEAEGVEEVAEFFLLFFWGDAEDAEHFGLEVFFVDADGAAAEFVAVEDDVVGDGADLGVVAGFEVGKVFGFGAGEGVVDGDPGVVFGAVGEEGEVDDPEEVVGAVVEVDFHHGGDVEAGAAEDGGDHFPGAGDEEDEVAFLDGEGGDEGGFFGIGEELPEGGFVFAAFALDEGEGFDGEAGLDGEFVEAVHLAGGDTGEAFGVDGADHAALVEGAAEDFEGGVGKDGGEVDELHGEAGVGLIAAVVVHGLLVGHAGEGAGDIAVEAGFEHAGEEAFDEGVDVGFADEGGFDVDLGELGLAVGAEVFVAEAAGDLEIFLEAGDLEHLFVLLGGLGEGVEAAGAEAGGDEEVAGAFWGGVGEDGGFDFDEAGLVEEVAGGGGDGVAQAEVAGEAGAAQVEVAVFEAEVFVGDFLIDLEGEDVGFVEESELGGDEFDFAGGDFVIFGAGEAGVDAAADHDDVFVAEFVACGGGLGIFFGAEDDLGDAFAVAQVDEDDAVVIAHTIDPAGEGYGLALMSGAKFVAMMGAIHGKSGENEERADCPRNGGRQAVVLPVGGGLAAGWRRAGGGAR